MLAITCKCGARYRVPETLAGKRAKCKHCNALIPIPKSTGAAPAQTVRLNAVRTIRLNPFLTLAPNSCKVFT